MKKFFGITMLVFAVLMSKHMFSLIDNLVWMSQQPGLPKEQYPLGVFSTPGGGALMLAVIVIASFGGGILIVVFSRRPQ